MQIEFHGCHPEMYNNTITGNIDSITVQTGNPISINWIVLPTSVTNNEVTLSSPDENILITPDNVIGAISQTGTYTVIITANDGSRVSKSITITVTE